MKNAYSETMVKNFRELLVEAERINDILTQSLVLLKDETKEVSKSLPRLTLEIQELKKTRDNLSSFLADKMKDVWISESKTLSHQLSSSFLEDTEKGLQEQKKIYEEAVKKILENVHIQIQQEKNDLEKCAAQALEVKEKYTEYSDQFRKDMDGIVATLKQLMKLQKQRLTRKGLLVCLVFCVASVLTGSGLFYFFPQNVRYQDMGTARYFILGKVTWDNLKNLSLKDQNLLLDGMNNYLRTKK